MNIKLIKEISSRKACFIFHRFLLTSLLWIVISAARNILINIHGNALLKYLRFVILDIFNILPICKIVGLSAAYCIGINPNINIQLSNNCKIIFYTHIKRQSNMKDDIVLWRQGFFLNMIRGLKFIWVCFPPILLPHHTRKISICLILRKLHQLIS